jgi:hypothetical protein
MPNKIWKVKEPEGTKIIAGKIQIILPDNHKITVEILDVMEEKEEKFDPTFGGFVGCLENTSYFEEDPSEYQRKARYE